MDGQGAIAERCGNCQATVPEDSGYENGRGDLLCTECFVDQWGPSVEELAMRLRDGRAQQPQAARLAVGRNDVAGKHRFRSEDVLQRIGLARVRPRRF